MRRPEPSVSPTVVRSLVPLRMDRLPWTSFHTRLVAALGVAWVLDGLEITVASSVAGALTDANTLHLSSTAVGAVASVYLAGQVVGALFFAIAQCFGAIGPIFYGHLIGNGGNTSSLFLGYLIGAGVMILGGVVELLLGIPAERRSLEAIARPLSLLRGATVPRAAGATIAFSPDAHGTTQGGGQ